MLLKTIKIWKKITNPSKNWWWLFLTATIATLFAILEPIAAAKIIDTIYSGNKNITYLWLSIALLFVVAKSISWGINYKFYPSVVGDIFKNLQIQVFNKVERINTDLFSRKNKEKLISMIDNDLFDIANFSEKLSNSFAGLIRVLIIMIIIAFISPIASAIILGFTILNAFIISIINKRILRSHSKLNKSRDAIVEKLSDCIDGSKTISQLNLEEKMKYEFHLRTQDHNTRLQQNSKLISIKDNWFAILWGFLQAGVVFFLINLVFDFKLTLPLFLIIIPYITTVVTRIELFFRLHNDSRKVYFQMQKFLSLQQLSESDLIDFGHVTLDYPDYKLSLLQIQLIENNTQTQKINFSLRKNEYKNINYLSGAEKEELIKILKREQKPISGKVYLDKIDVFLIDKKFYNNSLQIVDQTPYFFDDSIIKNLQLTERNKRKIYSVCNYLNISKEIKQLPNGYKTNPNHAKVSDKLLFLLGLTRAILSGSEILVLDYFPTHLTPMEVTEISSAIKKVIDRRTILQLLPANFTINN